VKIVISVAYIMKFDEQRKNLKEFFLYHIWKWVIRPPKWGGRGGDKNENVKKLILFFTYIIKFDVKRKNLKEFLSYLTSKWVIWPPKGCRGPLSGHFDPPKPPLRDKLQ
jgi:hypothetical protein